MAKMKNCSLSSSTTGHTKHELKVVGKKAKTRQSAESPQATTASEKKGQSNQIDIDSLKIPSLEEAIASSDRILGVSPECEIMPMNQESKIRGLCESIHSIGQKHAIEITSGGLLVNGRHRLIACAALGTEPEFKTVDPSKTLMVVLAEVHQREYNTATLAWIALKLEVYLNERCKQLTSIGAKEVSLNRRAEKSCEIPLGDGQRFRIMKGETIREAAIRNAGSTMSAVRRLTTVINRDTDLAMKAVHGEMNLREAERELELQSSEAVDDVENSAASDLDEVIAERFQSEQKRHQKFKSSFPRDHVPNAPFSENVNAPVTSINGGKEKYEGVTKSPKDGQRPMRREFYPNGVVVTSSETHTAIYIPLRPHRENRRIRVILDNGVAMHTHCVSTELEAQRKIDRFLRPK